MSLIIAAAQSKSIPGDVAGNAAHHVRFGEVAAEHGVQLLVFPELSLTGYELAIARAKALGPDSAELDPLRDLAARRRMTVVAGAPVRGAGDDLCIAAFVFGPDGSVRTHTKEHVHSSEAEVFAPGPGGPLLSIEEAVVALAICFDASNPCHAAEAAARGARVYAVGALLTAEDYAPKPPLYSGYAREHGMAVLLANYSGATGGWDSAGRSALWSEDGELVVASAGVEEELVIGVRRSGAWTGAVVPLPHRLHLMAL